MSVNLMEIDDGVSQHYIITQRRLQQQRTIPPLAPALQFRLSKIL